MGDERKRVNVQCLEGFVGMPETIFLVRASESEIGIPEHMCRMCNTYVNTEDSAINVIDHITKVLEKEYGMTRLPIKGDTLSLQGSRILYGYFVTPDPNLVSTIPGLPSRLINDFFKIAESYTPLQRRE